MHMISKSMKILQAIYPLGGFERQARDGKWTFTSLAFLFIPRLLCDLENTNYRIHFSEFHFSEFHLVFFIDWDGRVKK